jgi:hypothetical protein
MAIKKKQLAKGILVNRLVVSRDGKYAAGHCSPGQGGAEVAVVELSTGKERRVSLGAPFTRVGAVDFLGPDLIVAALDDDDGANNWSVLVIEPDGQVAASRAVTKKELAGALAVGPEGQVALTVSSTLFLWSSGELVAGKAPRVIELDTGAYRADHLAWTEAGELLVLDSEKLIEFSPELRPRELALQGIETHGHLSCAGDAVAFLGSRTQGAGFADAICFVVDRKKGTVSSSLDSVFDTAHLEGKLLVGASGGLTWLKKKGWKKAERTPELQGGYVMRAGLDGEAKEVVPMKLARVDAFASAGDVVVIGSHRGLTWMSGVFEGDCG